MVSHEIVFLVILAVFTIQNLVYKCWWDSLCKISLVLNNRIVVDFGTALTFTVMDNDGTIQGVNIAPGIKTALKALVGNTAQLSDIPLELPDTIIGKNTVHAIQSGVLWGYVSLIKGMLEGIKIELNQPCKVIATGGLSNVLEPLNTEFDLVDVQLTLNGLVLIQEMVCWNTTIDT